MHLFLDLDNTLIDIHLNKAYTRPYLDEFLQFCFTNFTTVNIWTAADKSWWNKVQKKILYQYKFNLVLTSSECKSDLRGVTKPLHKLWDDMATDYSSSNTFIIDDNKNYCRLNLDNYLPIQYYCGGTNTELLKMIDVLTLFKSKYELMAEPNIQPIIREYNLINNRQI